MSAAGPSMYYVFVSVCALVLVWQVRPARVTGAHQVDEAPVHFVPLPDNLQSSPAAAALDPRVDPEIDVTMEMASPEPGVVQGPEVTADASTGEEPAAGGVRTGTGSGRA